MSQVTQPLMSTQDYIQGDSPSGKMSVANLLMAFYAKSCWSVKILVLF